MQKIKLNVFSKMMKSGLSRLEVLFLLEICKYQSHDGTVSGVYYRDICDKVGKFLPEKEKMSNQRFYDILRSLSCKGIISYERVKNDYDIKILDNDFSDSSFSEGYINVSNVIFRSKAFASLKGNEMLLYMDILKNCESNNRKKDVGTAPGIYKISFSNFLNKYSDIFCVSERVIKWYLESIRSTGFFTVSLTQQDILIFQPKKLARTNVARKMQSIVLREFIITKVFRRYKIKYSQKDFKDCMVFLNKYGRDLKDSVFFKFESFVVQMLKLKNRTKYRIKRYFDSDLIENMFKKEIASYAPVQCPSRTVINQDQDLDANEQLKQMLKELRGKI